MLKFRKIKLTDKKEIEKLLIQLTGKKVKVDMKSLIKDEGADCLVLEENGKIIGFGSLIIHQIPCEGFVARIEDVIIDQNQRGKGYGRKMMEELIKIAKKKKIKKINLTSNPKRVEARSLYESLGFELYDTGVFRLEL
ncbi:MAG: GNAT family N-acetyltransferase [Patescibacteria group bacterium]